MKPINIQKCDVLVIGASLEGCIAAAEAAGKNKRVLLIENNGSLGQASSNGLYVYLPKKNDIPAKVRQYADYILKGAGIGHNTNNTLYKDQKLKVVLWHLLKEAGVQILTHLFLAYPLFNEGILSGFRFGTKTGFIDVTADIIIDATDKMEAGTAAGLKAEAKSMKVKAGIKLNQIPTEAIRAAADKITEYDESHFVGTMKCPLRKSSNGIIFSAENLGLYHDAEYGELIITGLTAFPDDINPLTLSLAQAGLRRFAYELRDNLRRNVKGFDMAHIIHVSSRTNCYGIRRITENPYYNLLLVNNDVKEYSNLKAIELGIKAGKAVQGGEGHGKMGF